ncbi:LCP family protein [Streptomyces sp. NPDC050264]|uniref:LCP family protein n=1 Tax=Streptomyces sp. NPDC050264 TaxID=3155038 RepID=UPI00342302DC
MGRSGVRGVHSRPNGEQREPSSAADESDWDETSYTDESRPSLDGRPSRDGDTQNGERRVATGRPRRRRGRRVLRWTALTLAVLILGTAGAGYLWYQHLNSNIEKGKRSSADTGVKKAEPNAAGQTPINILLIGSDSRNSAENVKLGGSKQSVGNKPLADVQMLIHISANRENASIISIPRDTRVNIPACEDPEAHTKYPATNTIINESLQRGGPGCTLATWEKLTGLYIDHWMMVDFAGVVTMADAVGGVGVCVKQNVWDRPLPGVPGGSGLKLTAGDHKVKGKSALQWLRTRHAFYSDLGRAKAQHMYMSSMLRTLREQDAFSDSGRLLNLAESATKALKVSEEVGSVKKLYDLSMQLKRVPSKRMTTLTMPTAEDPQNRNHLVPATADAEKIWAMLRDDVALDKNSDEPAGDNGKPTSSPSPSTDAHAAGSLPVLVRNGTNGAGQAAVPQRANTLAQVLQQKGFTRAAADSTAFPLTATVVAYPENAGSQVKEFATLVAQSLGIPTSAVKASDGVTAVTVSVGADWREGSTYPKQKTAKAGDVPDTADALNGSDEDACMDVYKPYRW